MRNYLFYWTHKNVNQVIEYLLSKYNTGVFETQQHLFQHHKLIRYGVDEYINGIIAMFPILKREGANV